MGSNGKNVMGNFSLEIDAFREKFLAKADLVTRKLLFDLSYQLVMLSPVKTGRFRGNWQYGFGSPGNASGTLDPSGEATVEKIQGSIGQGSTQGIHYITNNLPYAMKLEYGYSKQAPAGMVRITVLQYQEMVDNAVRSTS